jgi:hypothetical protein
VGRAHLAPPFATPLPTCYELGDYVMVKNVDVTPNVNKKLLPKFRGPYEIKKVLGNDRYLISNVENFQVSQIPYEGVCCPENRPQMPHDFY